MSRVPTAQLKADAPDSPLSSVLASLNQTSRKADTAYRRGEDLRREVEAHAVRLAALEGAPLAAEVAELKKWRVSVLQRLQALTDFVNDSVVLAQTAAGKVDGLHKQMAELHIGQADETRKVAAEVADLRRRLEVRK